MRTDRLHDEGFPLSLKMVAYPEADDIDRGRVHRHNRALTAYMNSDIQSRKEKTVFDLAQALQSVADTPQFHNGFGAEHVVYPLFLAFGNALDHDSGRIDCSTMSEWSQWLMDAIGFDTGKGEFK